MAITARGGEGMEIKKRNKQVKTLLAKKYGAKNISVTGGRGTAYGWVRLDLYK